MQESLYLKYQSYISPGVTAQTETNVEEIQINFMFYNYNQKILYIRPLLEILKLAWVQYLSLLIPLFLMGDFLLKISVKYKIFDAMVKEDFPCQEKKSKIN